jgi:hemerythrin-like metal-binding protein
VTDLLWGETLSIEIDEIDEDHRRLIELFNILNHAVEEGDTEDYVGAVFEELISCTAWHFRHEERLMLKYGYLGAEEHKAEHLDLIDSVKALQQKYLQADKQLSNEDIEFLEHWLTGHILGADKDLGAYLVTAM